MMTELANMTFTFADSLFFRLKSKAALARYLYQENSALKKLLALPERERYRFRITRKKSKPRWVQEPIDENRKLHDRIFQILARLIRPDYVYSGTKGKSYVKNARVHQGARAIFKTDIRKFYPSVLWSDVFRFFRKRMECSRVVAEILSDLCTIAAKGNAARDKRHLPTGSPLSEVLAYWCFSHMFDLLAEECERANLRITTYVDDIAISGDAISNDFVRKILGIIGSHGLHAHKSRLWVGRPACLTGVIITIHGCRLPNRRHLEIVKNRKRLKRMKSDDSRRAELASKTVGQCFEASQLVPELKNVGRTLQLQHLRALSESSSHEASEG